MASDPVPPPVILAIPAPSPPPNPSSISSNPDPPNLVSDQSSPPSDSRCPSSDLAPPPPSSSALASATSPASQAQGADLSRRVLPADLLCFQSFLPPSSSVEPSPVHLFPAAPEPPPATPPASVAPAASALPPLPTSQHLPPADAHLPAQPADPHLRPQPVCRNATAASVALPPLLQPPPVGLPHAAAFPPLPSGALAAPLLSRPADVSLPAQPAGSQQRRTQPVRQNAQATPLSYAQATKGAQGSGFVRAHARDVDSFARLPRTGINVISGSHEGIPVLSLVQSDMHKVEGLYAKALVMKFHGGRPSLAASHKEISNWGFESPFSIGPLTSRSFLLRFQDERDLLKTLTRPSTTLINFPYKIFRWHNRCHLKEDSSVVPIWISLPGLPLQCFAPEFLESIANTIGRFLCLDKATATLARPSEARMCVELDLRKERMQFIWIKLFEGVKQPIVYERVPKFCSGCHMQGHTNVDCSKVSLDTPQTQESGPLPAFQERSQPVRRNVNDISAAVSHGSLHQYRAPSVAAAATLLSASDLPHQGPPDISFQQPHPSAADMHAPEQSLQNLSVPSQQQFVPPTISPAVLSSEQQHTRPITPAPLLPPPYHPPSQPAVPAAQPHLQSSITVALQQHLPQSPSTAKASSSFSSLPVAAATHQPVTPSPSYVEEFSSSSPCPVAAPPHNAQDPCPASAVPQLDTDQPPSLGSPPSSEAQPVGIPRSETAPAADFSPTQVLSAQAAPFSPSDPVQSSQKSTALINQHSTSSLGFFYNKHGAKCMNMPSRPGEMVNRQQGNQGHLSSLLKAPTPSKFPLQNHHFEGFESEGSFETDSQQNSPSGSPLKEVNQCIFPPQVSEGEDLTEDHPGFQGHNSDVDFYHRPRSSKKNKRQPDGPLRIQLRARKGPSSRK